MQLFIMANPLNAREYVNSFDAFVDPQNKLQTFTNHINTNSFQLKNYHYQQKNTGHWNTLEKQLYHIFIKYHKENFVKKELRRSDKIFKEMSKFVKTRAADQCRSHHQKMQKKFVTIDNILQKMSPILDDRDYLEIIKPFQNQQTRHSSIYTSSESQWKELSSPVNQSTEELGLDSSFLCSNAVDNLELAIHPQNFFLENVFNIDDYFLM